MGMMNRKNDNAYFGEASMGCDIHFVLENYDDKTKKWIGVYSTETTPRMPMRTYDDHALGTLTNCVPSVGTRNYKFFASLAGVRGEGPEPNGVPDNASDLAKRDVENYGKDGHSHGHCGLDEFYTKHMLSTDSKLYKKLVVDKLKGETSVLDALFWENEAERANYRFIFWFDN